MLKLRMNSIFGRLNLGRICTPCLLLYMEKGKIYSGRGSIKQYTPDDIIEYGFESGIKYYTKEFVFSDIPKLFFLRN